MARPSTDASVLGAGTTITGNLSGEGALRIEGRVTGNVRVTGPAELSGSVEGDLSAEALELSGTLIGDVKTTGPIHVRAGAVVRGVLDGARVSIEKGASVAVRLDTPFELDVERPRRR